MTLARCVIATLVVLLMSSPAIGQQANTQPVSTVSSPVQVSDLLLSKTTSNVYFLWRVPPEVGLIPLLLRPMRGEAEKVLADTLKDAADNDPVIAGSSYEENWTVEADTPHLLSLLGTIDSYEGGAHGMQTFKTVLWDKQAGRRIAFADLFTSWPKAREAISPDVCAALKEAREAQIGRKIQDFDCPPLDEQAVTIYSWREGIEYRSIHVSVAPYVIGGFVEGSYNVIVDFPQAALALVKAPYRVDLIGEQ